MKTIEFKSTKGGKFEINLPKNYKQIKLPSLKKWVSALEGGKYRQCTSTLCSPDNKKLTYCCLGVLSKAQGRLNKIDRIFKDRPSFEDGPSTRETGGLDVSNPLYGILNHRGAFPKGVKVTTDSSCLEATDLVDCNDGLYLSFKDIAKIIKTLYKA